MMGVSGLTREHPMDKKLQVTLKEKLEKELAEVEGELGSIGRVNPKNPADWEALPATMDVLAADSNEVADRIESYEENTAILKQLEIRFNEIKTALAKVQAGTYGVCSVCSKPIDEKRLMANPAATSCVEHMG